MLNMLRERNLLKNISGAATVEFVVIFPFFLSTFFWIMETGYITYQSVQLDRGVDLTVRELMTDQPTLGKSDADAHAFLKQRVCDFAILHTCEDNIKLSLKPISDYSTFGTVPAQCRDRIAEVDPAYTPAYEHEASGCTDEKVLMEVQACLLFDSFFPPVVGESIMSGSANDGAYQIRAISAFLNEPC
ncbi:MAG: TadE family protein [Pseudomonadota bacterium]